MVQAPDQFQVLRAGQVLVDGGVLADEADGAAHGGGLGDHVEARDRRPATIRLEECGEHPDKRCLSGAVGPEEGDDGRLGDGQVQPVQGTDVAEGLGQAAGEDGWGGRHGGLWKEGVSEVVMIWFSFCLRR